MNQNVEEKLRKLFKCFKLCWARLNLKGGYFPPSDKRDVKEICKLVNFTIKPSGNK